MKRKTIAMFLVLSMCLSLSSVALASESTSQLSPNEEAISHAFDESYWEPIEVILDDGSIVQFSTHLHPDASEGSPSTRAINPEVPVGTKRTVSYKITNGQLGAPLAIGSALSSAAKKALAKQAAKLVIAQFGPIAGAAATIAAPIGSINELCGKNGFIITVNLKYTSTFLGKEGHSVYGWDITGASFRTY